MYEIMKKIITHKTDSKENITKKLDIFLSKNKLTLEQYEELTDLLIE